MKKLSKVVTVCAKIFEVLHFVSAFLILLIPIITNFLISSTNVEMIEMADKITFREGLMSFEVYGMGVDLTNNNGNVNMGLIITASVGSFLILVLMGMVFRNVYLILKTSNGETSFSNGRTFFQKDIVRMVREIGIFYILSEVVALIVSIIMQVAFKAETSASLSGFLTGAIIIVLSEVFANGMELQKDVDGLL